MACRGTFLILYRNVRIRTNIVTNLTRFSTNLQSADNPEALKCKVCSAPYMVEKGSQFSLSHGFTPRQWLQTASLVTMMCMSLGGSWAVIQLYSEPWIRMLAVGIALLIQYLCLRYDHFTKYLITNYFSNQEPFFQVSWVKYSHGLPKSEGVSIKNCQFKNWRSSTQSRQRFRSNIYIKYVLRDLFGTCGLEFLCFAVDAIVPTN